MALTPGIRLGPYEILAKLGEGGMGEVYRAHDSKLDRDVALKILPATFASDPDRLMRFEREAKTLASLNHPNIAHIHGLEEGGGVRALVMELVEGEDLSGHIARGPMPLADALPIARQIALALEAAHEAGIIHRDLKPANIKVRPDGSVKVLDFGLAKALDANTSSAAADHASSATLTSPAMTQAGMILGTASYMSPEQARGRPMDRRSDLWAFGVVLLEMITGRPVFAGDTVTDVIAAVVTRDPDWRALPAATPAAFRRLLTRCLEKDPSRRLRDAADARLDIEEALRELESGTTIEGTGGVHTSAAPRPWPWIGLAAVSLVTAIGVGVAAWRNGGSDPPLRILNLTVPTASASTAAISPDGRSVAVVADRKIMVKGIGEPAWHELPGTSGAGGPLIWSADSRLIAFPVESAIRKVDLVGSRPQAICERCVQPNSLRGGSWNRDGVLILGGIVGGLLTIHELGGTIQRVTTVDAARGENSHRYPAFLPDGRRFTFTVRRDNGEHEIRVGDLSGGPSRTLVSGFSKTAYAAGHVLFARDETLLALPFDPAAVAATGDPVKVADRVSHNVGTGLVSFAVSDEGTLVFGQAAETRGYVFFDRHGRKLADVTTRTSDGGGRFSPDGRRAAVAEIDAEKSSTDVYVVDLVTGARTRLTSDPGWDQQPVWAPDGARLAYRLGPAVYVQEAAGGSRKLVSDFGTGSVGFVHDWSADARYLLLTRSSMTGGELVRLSLADGAIEPIAPSEATQAGDARLSSDGRWVAYLSRETGSTEVHVRSFPDGRASHRVTTTGGDTPLWSRDGRELYYRDGEGWVVAARVTAGGATITTGPPERLFRPSVANSWGVGYQHDVDANGRFLVYRVGDDAGSFANVLTVMLNWTKTIAR